MILSKKLKKNPRELAAEILANLEIDKNIISKTEIAGPGFINFYFAPSFISEIIKDINERGDDFGKVQKIFRQKSKC